MRLLTEDGYQRTNREMSMEPRSKWHYCSVCDRNGVAAGEKCAVCGQVDGQKRSKRGKPLVKE